MCVLFLEPKGFFTLILFSSLHPKFLSYFHYILFQDYNMTLLNL